MTCMSMRCSWSPMITVRHRRPEESLSSSLSPGRRLAVATGVSSGHELVAVVDELQGVRLIRGLDVIDVDVQVVGRFQKIIREHRSLALIQREVHVGGDQRATLTLGQGLAHIQGGGRIWTIEMKEFRYRKKGGKKSVYQLHLLVLLSVRPHEESMYPSSGSGLQRETAYTA